MKEENPDASFGELGKLLGAAWKELDEADRCVIVLSAPADDAQQAVPGHGREGQGVRSPSRRSPLTRRRYEEECKAAGIDPKAKKAKAVRRCWIAPD